MKTYCKVLVFLVSITLVKSVNSASPTIVASIPPFYNLVSAVMKGAGKPKLLVNVGASPHDYALRPSNVQALKEADIIFWAGPALETFLTNPLNSLELKPGAKVVALVNVPGLKLLPVREGKFWEEHSHNHDHDHQHKNKHEHKNEHQHDKEREHDQEHQHDHKQDNGHEHEHEHESHSHSNIDMHFWLDPDNAQILIDNIVQQLSAIDNNHADLYKQNGLKMKQELKILDKKLKKKLAPVKDIPFIVFHDAYQYFERHYGLTGVGSITIHPEIPPSAQRLLSIRETIQTTNAHCVFTEPQFQPKLVESIISDTGVKTGQLDPLGQLSENNRNGYFELLENLADALTNCLLQ